MVLDIVIFSLYLYIFVNHITWKQAENAGMGYEEDPSPELMYNEEFNKNATQTINIRLFSTLIAITGFTRSILSLMVTETFGPIVITILFMF